jgi:hypothetical protein
MHGAQYGTYKHGRLTYRTAEEARGAAADLGLSDVHSHMVDGSRVFMPGGDHEALNQALQRRGMRPVEPPEQRQQGGLFDLGMGGGGGGYF